MVDFSQIQTQIDNLEKVPLVKAPKNFIKRAMISVLRTGKVPAHIGLIMDGNRRFAKSRGLKLEEGHSDGARSLAGILETCYKLQVSEVTIYAFSIENFNRPKEEVDTLFGMLRDKLQYMSEFKDSYVHKYKVRVKIIGNKTLIPEDILKDLNEVEERTNIAEAERTLNVCFPYTSRDDITNAIRCISRERDCNSISKEDIDEKLLGDNMYMGAKSLPLDLLIRTSGHYRLSDFMLWQSTHNCKVEFIDTLWPNFRFLSLFGILLNWGFQKHLEDQKLRAKNTKECFQVDLSSLPKPPPFASVGGKS